MHRLMDIRVVLGFLLYYRYYEYAHAGLILAIFISPGQILRSGVFGYHKHMGSMSNFVSNFQTVLPNCLYPYAFPSPMHESSCCFWPSPAQEVVSPNYSYSNGVHNGILLWF